jgi:Histidine phosphatase superfamily (branch 2)
MSAESDLASFMAPFNNSYRFDQSLDWRPVPVHTIDLAKDYLLVPFDGDVCPQFGALKNARRASSAYQQKAATFAPLMKTLSGILNVEITVENAFYVADTITCDLAHNRTLLPGFTQQVIDQLQEYTAWHFTVFFQGVENRKRAGGFLLSEIIERMDTVIADPTKLDTGRKIKIYSAHDTTIGAFLTTLNLEPGVYNNAQPPYASHVYVELYKDGTSYFVRTFFNDKPIQIKGCAMDCPLDQFKTVLADVIPTSFDVDCVVVASEPENPSYGWRVLIMLILIAFAGILGYFGYRYYQAQERKRAARDSEAMLDTALFDDTGDIAAYDTHDPNTHYTHV